MTVTVDKRDRLGETINTMEGGTRRFAIGMNQQCDGQTVELEVNATSGNTLVVGDSPADEGGAALLGTVIDQQVAAGGAVAIFDASGNAGLLHTLYGSAFRAHRAADFFSVSPFRPYESNTYNAILYNPPYVVAEQVVKLIASDESHPASAFHQAAAKDAVTVLISALKKVGLPYCPLDLALFLLRPELVLELLATMRARFGSAGETTNLSDWIGAFMTRPGDVDRDEYRQVIGGLAEKLYMLAAGMAGGVLNAYRPEVSLHRALSHHYLVHLDLPGGAEHRVATAFRQMAYIDLREALRNRRRDGSSVLLIFNGADAMDGEIAKMMRSWNANGVAAWFAGGVKIGDLDMASTDPITLMGHSVTAILFTAPSTAEFILRKPEELGQTVWLAATVQDEKEMPRFSRQALNRDIEAQPEGASQFTRTLVA